MGINRNDPCPCGSGKKYKKCCLDKESARSVPVASALLDQAFALHQQGRLDEALALYEELLVLEPDNPNAMHLAGVACLQQEKFAAAIERLRLTIDRHGPQRDFLYNLGNALRGARQDEEAIATYRQLLERYPDDIDTLNNLGIVYRNRHQPRDAHACFATALKLVPQDADLLINVGLSLFELNRPDEAIDYYLQAIKRRPEQAESWNNLGAALQQTGDPERAQQMLEKALTLRPNYPDAQSNLAFCLDFKPEPARQQQARKQWAASFSAQLQPYSEFANSRDPGRRLRIGYVSADFRQHSAAYAFGALLLYHDPVQFEIVCFSNSTTEDALTRRFKSAVAAWHEIYALSDEEAAAFIHAQNIDILIDLSGHSKGNRLGVFARKPAPLQATGWGHANGTGLATVDYLFADSIYIPPEEAVNYAEKLCYLPCTLGYFQQGEAPPVAPLPMLSKGYPTFGSFSRLAKVGKEALAAWAELLKAIPDSRLIIKAPEIDSPGRRAHLAEFFVGQGIAADRLSLFGGSPWFEHLQVMSEVDIILDPFPHGGGVTMLDGLWMGVPAITVRYPMPTGRLAAAILHAMDLDDWVLDSAEELIAHAQKRLADPAALATLRAGLRQRMQDSEVGNPQRYVRALEAELCKMWRTWCERQTRTA